LIVINGYDSGSLSFERKVIAVEECWGDVDSVIAAMQQLRRRALPGHSVYVAIGEISFEAEVVAKASLFEDTLEDGRVIYSISLDM
jgi:hypothetical protein